MHALGGIFSLVWLGVALCVVYIGSMLAGTFMFVSPQTAILYLAIFWIMLLLVGLASKHPYFEDAIIAFIVCACLNVNFQIHPVFNMLLFAGCMILFINAFEYRPFIRKIKGWFFTGLYFLIGVLLIVFRMNQLDNIWKSFFVIFFAAWCWMGRNYTFTNQEKNDSGTTESTKRKHYRPDAPELHSMHIALMEQTSGILLEDKIGNDASKLKTGTKQEYYNKRKEAYKTYIEKYYNDEPEPLTEKFVNEYEKALTLYKKEVDKIDSYYIKDNA